MRDYSRPVLLSDPAYDHDSWFILCPSRNLEQINVIPQFLGLNEIDAVLGFVRLALSLVEFVFHGIENIPFQYILSIFVLSNVSLEAL